MTSPKETYREEVVVVMVVVVVQEEEEEEEFNQGGECSVPLDFVCPVRL